MFHTQDSTTTIDFDQNQITDIREILFEDKTFECELLKADLAISRKECEGWKKAYDSVIRLLINYCRK
jgi:hypothetical protein